MPKKWLVTETLPDDFISEFPEINPLILQLLYNRGIKTQSEIDEFLYPDYEKDVFSPFLLLDMEKAVQRIFQAIKQKEKVLVYGDYDADGVTSSVLAVSVLQDLGLNVGIYIPHRDTEGYGLNQNSVQEIIKQKYNLVITVDCGISNKKEIAWLQENKIDVIVTDHHSEPLELPAAFAVIDPKLAKETYPCKHLAGVGVAYKLMQGVLQMLPEELSKHSLSDLIKNGNKAGYLKWLLDLVALGTIADCMPLISENRTFVKYGLVVLSKSRRLGVQELVAHAGIKLEQITPIQVAFQLGPRINAAGRLDHANVAYQLLLTQDQSVACALSNKLNDTNVLRQKITDQICEQVKKEFLNTHDKKILFSLGQDWPVGVVGLVAGKFTDIHNTPVIIMTQNKENIIGSGRSISAFNMIEALTKLDKYFAHYGGHSQACGFTLKDPSLLAAFMKDMEKLAEKSLRHKDLTPVLNIELEVGLADINWGFVESLELFAPYGQANNDPLFLIKNLEVVAVQLVGNQEKHMRLVVMENKQLIRKCIGFGLGGLWGKQLKTGDIIDVVCSVSVNQWNGTKEIQLKVEDLRFS